ncbi:MAG: hypothetical protein O3B86_15255 [Planctomycetota bacterium]|nr:hypothetical protein [Planctomycetota bacterium]
MTRYTLPSLVTIASVVVATIADSANVSFAQTTPVRSPGTSICLDDIPDDLDSLVLKKSVRFNFKRVPLIDALAQISKRIETPIVLDQKAVANGGLLVDEPVTFTTEPPGFLNQAGKQDDDAGPAGRVTVGLTMTVEQVLSLMLRHLDLTWAISGGTIYVTTHEAARATLIDRSYDLTPFRTAGISDQRLKTAITADPESRFYGGRIGSRLVIVGHIMTIKASYSAQRKVRALLEQISNPDLISSAGFAQQEQTTGEQLSRIVDADFLETPLIDAIEILAFQSNGRIIVDTIAIEESGLLRGRPITFSLNGKSLRQTLDLLLKDLGLVAAVHAGELFVTTANVARELWTSRVYDLRSIPRTKELHDSVVNALMTLTSGQWEDTDAGGSMIMFENGLLVVVTGPAVHAEIKKLAEFYKRHLSKPNRQSCRSTP